MRRAHSVAAGEPGHMVDQFGKELLLSCLLFLPVLEIAVVLILELLQIPEVPCQGQIDRAVEGKMLPDRVPANYDAVEVEVLQVYASTLPRRIASDNLRVYTLALVRLRLR